MSYTLYLTDQEHQLFQREANGDAGMIALFGAEFAKTMASHSVRIEPLGPVGVRQDLYDITKDAQGVVHTTVLPISKRAVKTGK